MHWLTVEQFRVEDSSESRRHSSLQTKALKALPYKEVQFLGIGFGVRHGPWRSESCRSPQSQTVRK